MNPTNVRDRIVADQTRLRVQIDALERALDTLRSDASQLAIVADRARTLLRDLVVHTELEDAIVAPILCDVDAWGPVRADLLLSHHDQQRRELAHMIEMYASPCDPEDVARRTLAWIRAVRADMHHEELDVVSEFLFRDDLVAVDMECG
jgi:hypothetical protein